MSPRGLGVMERELPGRAGSSGGRFSSGGAAGPKPAGSPGSRSFPLADRDPREFPEKAARAGERGSPAPGSSPCLPRTARRSSASLFPPSQGPPDAPALRGAESDALSRLCVSQTERLRQRWEVLMMGWHKAVLISLRNGNKV